MSSELRTHGGHSILQTDTVTPILQTDASDYGIGGYLHMIVNHQVRVIRLTAELVN
jgi:hypothetical protein